MQDAIEEQEDLIGEEDEENEAEEEGNDAALPNNDFTQYTMDDLLRHEDNINIATLQLRKRSEAWEKIRSLNGTEVTKTNSKDGKITWKVVTEVLDDNYLEVLKKEREYLKKTHLLRMR